MARAFKWLGVGAFGAFLAWLFDPQQGRRRRAVSKDRMAATFRQKRHTLAQKARYAGGQATGMGYRMAGAGDGEVPADDKTLEAKIESELLGKAEWKGCSIKVMVSEGVVDLRGEVGTPADINRLEREVAKFPGVQGVNNHVHLPNTVNTANR